MIRRAMTPGRSTAAMDESETIARAHLESLGYTDIVFEPEGRDKPPDFRVNGIISVEVRRLNQYVDVASVVEGVEKSWFPLRDAIDEVLKSAGPPTKGVSWHVMVSFRRPIRTKRILRKQVQQILQDFSEEQDMQSGRKSSNWLSL